MTVSQVAKLQVIYSSVNGHLGWFQSGPGNFGYCSILDTEHYYTSFGMLILVGYVLGAEELKYRESICSILVDNAK